MDRTTFEAELARDGYQIVSIEMKPDGINPEHVHPFDARVFVADGALTIVRDDGNPTRTYRPGEWFEMPSGCRHSESAGPSGATYVAGRRAPETRRQA